MMHVLQNVVGQACGSNFCRVKIQRIHPKNSTVFPMMLMYSRDGVVPPTILKDMDVFRAMDGRQNVHFVCRVEGNDLVLLQESTQDNW